MFAWPQATGWRDGDSGACLLAFGTVRKWMSERTSCVYIIMTANDVSKLPSAFTRKGRIDEIYGIHVPTTDERAEIFRIHLGLKDRIPEQFDLDEVAEATKGCTGAAVKQVVTLGLKFAFHQGKELANEHLLQAVPEIRPLSQTDPERVTVMTEWLDRHAKPASLPRQCAQNSTAANRGRQRRVAV